MNNFFTQSVSPQYNDTIEKLYKNEIKQFKNEHYIGENWSYSCLQITFQVTESCNLNCSYCYQINKKPKYMTKETAKKLVDYILSDEYFNKFPSYSVILDFIGGEPFLAVKTMDFICEYFISEMIRKNHIWLNHFNFNLTSNGTLYFTDEVQEFVNKYKNCLSVTVTVDGCKELHDKCRKFPDGSGSYDIALSAAKDLMNKTEWNKKTKMTISPENMSYIPKAVKNFISEGFDDIFFNCIYEYKWTEKDAQKYYYLLKEVADYMLEINWLNDMTHIFNKFNQGAYKPTEREDTTLMCGGNGKMLAFDCDGKMFSCIRYMDSSLGGVVQPLPIGDLKLGLLKTSEYIENFNNLASVTTSSMSEQKCLDCKLNDTCPYCLGWNYQETKQLNKRSTNLCNMTIAEALVNVYFWNKFYVKNHYNQIFLNHCPDDWALKIIDEKELLVVKEALDSAINRDNEFEEVYVTNYSKDD